MLGFIAGVVEAMLGLFLAFAVVVGWQILKEKKRC